MALADRRVVVTGMGAVTPLGLDLATTWNALLAGRSGITLLPELEDWDVDTKIGGRVPDFDVSLVLDRKEARRMDRYVHLAFLAAKEALSDSGVLTDDLDPRRAGVYFGTGIGGMVTFCDQHVVFLEKGPKRVSPFFIPMLIANMAAGQLAIAFGFLGPNVTTVTACASSANAIGDAFRAIERGDADVVLAGGGEAVLIPLAYAGFGSMRALSTRNDAPEAASRPFDRARDGFVMAEGAGLVVLEEYERARRRGAKIYAEVLGYGLSSDAFHVVEPRPDGKGAAEAMARSLEGARLAKDRVGYINAHATSTPKGDLGEALAIQEVFGPHAQHLYVSATKSMTGHLLGAAGAVEFIFTVLAVAEGRLPPTINLDDPEDVPFDLVPGEAKEVPVQYALTNSFGFGGHNVSLLIGRPA
jgi:3-oxoacyl-[acyl-carrier-protein] synthase II